MLPQPHARSAHASSKRISRSTFTRKTTWDARKSSPLKMKLVSRPIAKSRSRRSLRWTPASMFRNFRLATSRAGTVTPSAPCRLLHPSICPSMSRRSHRRSLPFLSPRLLGQALRQCTLVSCRPDLTSWSPRRFPAQHLCIGLIPLRDALALPHLPSHGSHLRPPLCARLSRTPLRPLPFKRRISLLRSQLRSFRLLNSRSRPPRRRTRPFPA